MNIPQHVAIILDGNGRWAKSKGMPRNYGHARGAKNLEKICRDAYDIGIKYLTVYLFSTENWKRSREEVDGLMKLFRSYTKTCIKTARENNMKVRVLGDPTALADDLQESLKELDTREIPDPDLLIRTSGELRLSNYLLWQLAYSEFYFTEVPWPAFNKEELLKAIEKYNGRERRYGGVKGE